MHITSAEMEIMRIIWDLDRKVTTRELTGRLPDKKLTTISTLAGRLISKGVLTSEKIGRSHAHEYEAVVSEEEYQALQTKEFVKSIHRGSAKSLISALFANEDFTKEDIEELKGLIDERGQ
ncbi:MAG: BlaI/MecI/CopY family transcriptional regulator [Clostridiales bacterium]|jgi:predicted transcriptional regulator|nr:BlaI/MecI/CopY family transcriptional regulator [Clostridiales bacterium]